MCHICSARNQRVARLVVELAEARRMSAEATPFSDPFLCYAREGMADAVQRKLDAAKAVAAAPCPNK